MIQALFQNPVAVPRQLSFCATLPQKFNTYCFADYKEKVIDLLMRVTTVSVRTVTIIESMRKVVH